MKHFKFKNVVGLALTLCLTLAVMIPTAFAAALPLNTGSYNWTISDWMLPIKHEWNGKDAGQTWILGAGNYEWYLYVNGSIPSSLRADLRKVVPLGGDQTVISNNGAAVNPMYFSVNGSAVTYYAVVSVTQSEGASGTTSVYSS